MSRGGRPTACRVLVQGRVQGVGYRWAAMEEGNRLGLAGWVRNLPDGRVEVHAQGEAEALAALVAWLRHGPPGARVAALSEGPAAPEAELGAFEIRR